MTEAVIVVTMVVFLITGVLSWAGTGAVRRWFLARQILDQPNSRSSHQIPVPRGGGVAVVLAVAAMMVPIMITLGGIGVKDFAIILGITLIVAGISFWDDLRGLPAWVRLLCHVAAVAAGIFTLPDTGIFQGWLPRLLDHAVAALLWVWFINLYNFMDGIDGLAALETIAISLGLAIVSILAGTGVDFWPVIIAGAACGFLIWNFPPAKIFLGDVGSVALGYMLGYLLLMLASHGAWAAALILPMYYLVDATITLLQRCVRGEKIWQAHREHAYQKAVIQGSSHGAVIGQITLCNIFLVILAGFTMITSPRVDMVLVGFAFGLSAILWRHLSRQRR